MMILLFKRDQMILYLHDQESLSAEVELPLESKLPMYRICNRH